MTADTVAAGLFVAAGAMTVWAALDWWLQRRARRRAQARHPSSAGLVCACREFVLAYPKQHVLDQDYMVHSRWNCAPFAEFIPPGR